MDREGLTSTATILRSADHTARFPSAKAPFPPKARLTTSNPKLPHKTTLQQSTLLNLPLHPLQLIHPPIHTHEPPTQELRPRRREKQTHGPGQSGCGPIQRRRRHTNLCRTVVEHLGLHDAWVEVEGAEIGDLWGR